MKTPYLDDAIRRHEKALSINMLSDGGKEALNEFKAIKQALRTHDVVGQSEQLVCDCGKHYHERVLEHGMCHQCWEPTKEAN